ncbi:hypothetical protein NQ317_007000 [Molorchus minor]|uniref:Protein ALP1-like n=1 Tax=Molorchus minor TaxID=1323400 RepID=A0ABQ9JV60_9CUCU|nr:hypothetical protein NQ317_007000 [Molorchus minor]
MSQVKSFSNCELAMIALLLDEENEANSTKRKRVWVHDMLKKRKTEGEYHTIYKELLNDETKFYQYFRMSIFQFNYLLDKIVTDIRTLQYEANRQDATRKTFSSTKAICRVVTVRTIFGTLSEDVCLDLTVREVF